MSNTRRCASLSVQRSNLLTAVETRGYPVKK
jgi:hypothetical protein